jgi:hypothetical protein
MDPSDLRTRRKIGGRKAGCRQTRSAIAMVLECNDIREGASEGVFIDSKLQMTMIMSIISSQ